MKPVKADPKQKKTTLRAVVRDEEGKKRVEKMEVEAHTVDTIKYIKRKLADKGVQRMERHPSDGSSIACTPPKSGHGGKYTWEGPDDEAEIELAPSPPALDEKDPNYVGEEEEEEEAAAEVVVGEVDVPKAREVGVARVEVDPRLNT